MSKKKLIITIVALVLVCAVAIGGTVAYLVAESNDGAGITNTFTSTGGLVVDPEDKPGTGTFEIIEHAVKTNDDGTLELDTENDPSTAGNTYKVLPGIDLPKDPAINIVGKSDIASYLFIEVVDNLTEGIYEDYELEAVWQPLKVEGVQVEGNNGGLIYYYAAKAGDKPTPDTSATILCAEEGKTTDIKVNILKDNKLTVKADADLSNLPDGSEGSPYDTLEFYAYLAQSAGFDTVDEAFTTCFPAE